MSSRAGKRFRDIEYAGKHVLKFNCSNYPCTANSHILPPVFLSKFPESRNRATSRLEPRIDPPLNENEQSTFNGIRSGQGGEKTEYIVFYLLTKLLEEEQDVPLLVLREFELSTKGKGNLKRKALINEYPQIANIDMRGEQDCIIFLKDLGLIVIEIKRALTSDSVQKAKDQLDRSELFLNKIMTEIAPNSYRLPILKLVMFKLDDQQSPLALNSPGYHFFDCSGDPISAFKLKWKDFKKELQTILPAHSFTSLEFKRLARLLTGLWSLKSTTKQILFDVDDASVPYLTTEVDYRLNFAHLSSDIYKDEKRRKHPTEPPVTNIVYNHQGTVYREAKEISLRYLTPEQKEIYDSVRCGIIRGAAGTGKTLLILFKIIDLVQSQDNRKVILIAPHPHTVRCQKVLEANGLRVLEREDISNETEILHDVVVISIRNLHSVLSSSLLLFSNYHVFIDDLQSSIYGDDDISLPDVDLMKTAYETATQNNLYFWIMDDSLQQSPVPRNRKLIKQFYAYLFPTTRDNATVPVYSLGNVLRNTMEIANVALDDRHKIKSMLDLPSVDVHSSHNITSTLPTFQILVGEYDDNVTVDFYVERIEDELQPLVIPISIPLSNIALLYGNDLILSFKDELLKRTREMLLTRFNIVPMTIEQQLQSGSSTIVFDDVINAVSGEWPVVIYLEYSSSTYTSPYIGSSRARARLSLIGRSTSTRRTARTRVAHFSWIKKDSKFVRVGNSESLLG